MDGVNKIHFHDGYITKFIDGSEEKILEFNLRNVEVFVQEYKTEIVNYAINELSNSIDDKLYVFSGKYEIDNNEKFLKIWIDYPSNNDFSNIKEYNGSLNDIYVKTFSDYDGVGKIFIKFVATDIEVIN